MSDLTLVTGATGTIGSEVVKALVQKGAKVRVAVRDKTKAAKRFDPALDLVEFDFENTNTFQARLKALADCLSFRR